jgi:hypothetical protein
MSQKTPAFPRNELSSFTDPIPGGARYEEHDS